MALARQRPNLTDKFISTNQYGYNIDMITRRRGLDVPLDCRHLLAEPAERGVPSGDPVYWDENSGAGCGGTGGGKNCPSQASESAVGTVPSEAFTIGDPGTTGVPEPNSILLFASGILGLAGVLRCKLF